jgi:hypothetical protein
MRDMLSRFAFNFNLRRYKAAMRRMIINAGMLCDVAGNGKEALAAIDPGAGAHTRPLFSLN